MFRFGPAERTITANFGNRLELPLRVFKYPECRFRTLMMYLSPHRSVFGKAITYGPAQPFCGSPSVDEQWEKRIVFIKGDDALSDRTATLARVAPIATVAVASTSEVATPLLFLSQLANRLRVFSHSCPQQKVQRHRHIANCLRKRKEGRGGRESPLHNL